MNRVFKVIWSAARGVFVVCGELANGYGKAPSCKMRTIARAALVIGLSFALLSGTSYQATAGDANEIRKDGAGYAKGGDVWEYIHKFMAFQDVYYPNPIYNSPYNTPTLSIGTVDRSPGSIIIGGASQQISSSNSGFIGGGEKNVIVAGGLSSIIGGYQNQVGGVQNNITGGSNNSITNDFGDSAIIAGWSNTISNTDASIILSGTKNKLDGGSESHNNAILAGASNSIYTGTESTAIIAGTENVMAGGLNNVIVGGEKNNINCNTSVYYVNNVIIGGKNNRVENSNNSIVIGGSNSTVEGDSTLAMMGGQASGSYAVVIGDQSQTTAGRSVVLGKSSLNEQENSFIIGNDSINESRGGTGSFILGNNSTNSGNGSFVLGSNSTAEAGSFILGNNSTNSGNGSFVLGSNSRAEASNAVALGSNSVAEFDNTVSVGSSTAQRRIVNVSAGTTSTDAAVVSQTHTLSAGSGISFEVTENANGSKNYDIRSTSATGDGVIEEGNTGLLTGGTVFNEVRVTSNGTYVQKDNTASANLSALDVGLKAVSDDLQGLDSLAVKYDSTAKDQVTLGGADSTAPVKLTNTANGSIAADSKDAINGSQIYTIANVADNGNYITSGTDVAGNLTALDAAIGETSDGEYVAADKSVGENLKALDDAVKNVNDGLELAVKYDSADKAQATLGGADGTKITNVANGTIAAGSKDAINGGQLYAIANIDADGNYIEKGTDVAGNLGALDSQLKSVSESVDAGWNIAANDTTPEKIGSGETVTFKDGSNVEITQDGKELTIAVANAPTFTGKVTAKGLDAGNEKIENVADGTAATDAVNKGQLDAIADSVVKYDADDKALVTLEGTSGTKITNIADGTIGSGSKDAVNGGQLYTIVNVTADGKHIKAGTDVAGNLKALDTAIGETADGDYVAADNTVGQNLNALDSALKEVSDTANAGWNIQANDTAAVKVGSGETVTFKDGSNVEITQDGKELTIAVADAPVFAGKVTAKGLDASNEKIENVADGTTATDAVNKGQLDAIADSSVKYDSNTKDTVTLEGANGTKLTNVAKGTIGEDSKDAINGSQLYEIANVTRDGSYIASGTDVAGNLSALDAQVKANTDAIGTTADGNYVAADNSVGQNLNALDSALKDVSDTANAGWNIKANDTAAVKVGSGETVILKDGSNVEITQDGKELTIAVADAPIFAGKVTARGLDVSNEKIENVADGTTATDAVNKGQLDAIADSSVKYDSDTKDVVTLEGTSSTKITNLASGTIGEGSKDAVTGGQIHNLVNVAQNGNYITAGTDVAGNLVALDSQAKSNSDAITVINNTLTPLSADVKELGNLAVKYDSADKAQATLGGADGTKITNVANGTIAAGSKDAINGGQLYAIANVDADGNYIEKGTDVAGNLGKLDSHLKSIADSVGSGWNIAANDTEPAKVGSGETVTLKDGSNVEITQNGKELTIAVADAPNYAGKVTAKGLDAGNEKVENVADGTAATDAVNKGQLDAIADSSVKYDSDAKDTVTLEGANGTKLTNVANGTIGEGSKDAVTGGQIYTIANVTADGKHIKAGTDVTGNLAALDTAIGETSDGEYVAADNSVGENLKALDDAVKDVNDGLGLAVKYDSADKDQVTLGGNDGTKITNVANGTIAAGSKDAINGGQLHEIVNVAQGGNYIAAGTDVAGNLSALDAQVKVNTDAIGTTTDGDYVTADNSVGQNLNALDTALKNISETANFSWNIAANETEPVKVGSGETVTLKNGSNVEITQDGKELTIAVANAPTFTGKVTAKGFNAGNEKIENVADGTSATDAVNKGQLDTVAQSVEALDTLAVKYDSDAKQQVTLGGTDSTTPVKLTNVADGAISQGSKDAVNGGQLFTIANVESDGNYIKAGTDVAGNLGELDTQLKSVTDSVAAGWNIGANDETPVKVGSGETVKLLNGSNIEIEQNEKNIKFNVSDSPVFDGKVTAKGVDASGERIMNIADAVDAQDAVSLKQVQDIASEIKASASNTVVKAGRLVSVEAASGDAGEKIYTVSSTLTAGDGLTISDNDEIKIKLGDSNLSFNNGALVLSSNLNLGDNGSIIIGRTTINDNGVTINNGPSITNEGIDGGGKTITNIADAVNGNDAVTLKQVQEMTADANVGVAAGRLTKVDETKDESGKKIFTVSSTIKGGKGIEIDEDDKLNIVLASNSNLTLTEEGLSVNDKINLTEDGSITVGNTTMLTNGLSISDGPSITSEGIDAGGTRVKNIAEAVEDNDAVTLKQMRSYNSGKKVEVAAGKHIKVEKSTGDEEQTIYTVSSTLTGGKGIDISDDGSVSIKLADDSLIANDKGLAVNPSLNLGKSGSVKTGDAQMNKDGFKVLGGPSMTTKGIDAGGLVVTNLKAGAVTKDSTDAVTGAQLFATNQQVQMNTENIGILDKRTTALEEGFGKINQRFNETHKMIKKTGAKSAALAGLKPMEYDPSAPHGFEVAYGNYRGENAAALGAHYYFSQDARITAGVTVGDSSPMTTVGMSFRVGRTSLRERQKNATMQANRIAKLEQDNHEKDVRAVQYERTLASQSEQLQQQGQMLNNVLSRLEVLEKENSRLRKGRRK